MRWLVIVLLIAGCEDTDAPNTSHPPMSNQLEVGSTIDGRYRVVKKLADAGEHQVFAVEQAGFTRTLIAPAPREPALPIYATGQLPHGTSYVVVTANDEQLRELLRSIGS